MKRRELSPDEQRSLDERYPSVASPLDWSKVSPELVAMLRRIKGYTLPWERVGSDVQSEVS